MPPTTKIEFLGLDHVALGCSDMQRTVDFYHGLLGMPILHTLEYTGDDLDADNAAIAADEATRQWWTVCEPLQRPLDDRSPGEWWKAIPEVFHLD